MVHKSPSPDDCRLFTFGELRLADSADATVEHVRQRGLALLAVVAASGRHGLPRARALSIFWPEATEAHARNSLRQLLFHLRTTVGDDLFTREQRVLRLNALRISTDVSDFETLMARGDLAEACARYDGPFLDGFLLAGHEEFSTFVERRRDEIEQRFRDALRALARSAEHAGELGIAAEWWRTLAAADPVDPVTAVHLAAALEQAGRLTEAFAMLRAHAERVRKELGVEPTKTVRDMMARISEAIGGSEVGRRLDGMERTNVNSAKSQ